MAQHTHLHIHNHTIHRPSSASVSVIMARVLSSVEGSVSDLVQVRRALISVSDKSGLVELATFLHSINVELLSTGGTAKAIRNEGIPVIDVSDYTGSPEILDGRVKTLHPKIHGGLLAVRGNSLHDHEMSENGIRTIDLVVMNLYPFEATVASGADFSQCVENIDIGGPSMLRSSAKNHAYVAVVTSPNQYAALVSELGASGGCTSLATRRSLAASAFATSAAYDSAIAAHFAAEVTSETSSAVCAPPPVLSRGFRHEFSLKYGCNPHQKPAGVYLPMLQPSDKRPFDIVNGTPGYINLLDACNAWQLVRELRSAIGLPAAASFKHCSPAGAAVSIPLTATEMRVFDRVDPLSPVACAYVRARNADPLCSFGDFVAVSDVVDECTAKVLKTEVCDGIIAPGYEDSALDILCAKKKGAFIVLRACTEYEPPTDEFREVMGVGFLQRRNDVKFSKEHLQHVVTGDSISNEAARDLVLASITLKYTQSNSVGYALGGQMIGVGAGQQSRVDCVKLAGRKAATWFLRQHPKVLDLPFKASVKRQERVNARVRYIEGDIEGVELAAWSDKFDGSVSPLREEEKRTFLSTLSGVALSSDAFFPFRDSIDHAAKFGVKFVAQPGGSVADAEVIEACREYNMAMVFTSLRLFHH